MHRSSLKKIYIFSMPEACIYIAALFLEGADIYIAALFLGADVFIATLFLGAFIFIYTTLFLEGAVIFIYNYSGIIFRKIRYIYSNTIFRHMYFYIIPTSENN